ncbi:MAG: hypothetical protein LBK53_09515 [Heliobacteriaceae bacterium]|jgi:hypothetical protein|nr:hypothetical protein [Heliobacteriaceae bacterium]
MIKDFYEKMDVKPKFGRNIPFPDSHSHIYISEHGEVHCYTGIFSTDEDFPPHFQRTPYYWTNIKTKKYEDYILGFYRIKQGCIILDEFLDQDKYKNTKFKKLDHLLWLPQGSKRYFGISKDYESEDTQEVTREVFGLTQLELNEVTEAYARMFGLYKQDIMADFMGTRNKNIYPYDTTSNTKDNYCDITEMWIPPQFPYIKFSNKEYSHVSLYGFYRHLASLLLPRLYSDVTVEFKKYIREETFEKFCKIDFTLEGYKKLYKGFYWI